MFFLLTGGCGYIGSHTAVALLDAGHSIVLVDSLTNSRVTVTEDIAQAAKLSAAEKEQRLFFVRADLALDRDLPLLRAVFELFTIDVVIHFAALKSVGESVQNPVLYYQNNLQSLLNVLRIMQEECNEPRLIFSSSATVYAPQEGLVVEDAKKGPSNPYGWTKWMGEQILQDVARSNTGHSNGPWDITILRYMNPAGAHESGHLLEAPVGPANNLFPVIVEVMQGIREKLLIFGNDWNTRDGTGERDYVHVMDVAEAHVKAAQVPTTVKAADAPTNGNVRVYNIGTGRGNTVLEVMRAMEVASGTTIPHQIVARRAGDIGSLVVDATKAQDGLGWMARRKLDDMVRGVVPQGRVPTRVP